MSIRELKQAALDVLAERQRQIEAEGWTASHDDEHGDGEMARAAAWYGLQSITYGWTDVQGMADPRTPATELFNHHFYGWPWSHDWWKPKDRRSCLVKAGALILAEIERLDRANGVRGTYKDVTEGRS